MRVTIGRLTEQIPGIRVAAGLVPGDIRHTGDACNIGSHVHLGISRPTCPEDWRLRHG